MKFPKPKPEIFKGGYLTLQETNVSNYSTLTGFLVEIIGDTLQVKRLKCISNGACFFSDGSTEEISDVKIPEFTPATIPAGEWVWLRGKGGRWNLRRASSRPVRGQSYRATKVVPLLIAKTAIDAERLKGWGDVE
jgi:hypothetical protein